MAIPHWSEQPDVWDTVVLGGVTFPGVAEVEVERELEIDKKKPKGKHQDKPTIQGVKSAKVDITITLNTPEEWAAFQDALQKIELGADNAAGTPVDISHPVTACRGIVAILIEKITGPKKPTGGTTFCTVKIDAMEFDAPKKTTVSTGKGGGGTFDHIGTFVDVAGNLFSRVARLSPPGQSDSGQATYVDNNGQTFTAKFVLPDQLLADSVAKAKKTTDGGDVTKTPDAATGGDDGSAPKVKSFFAPKDPSTGDAGP